MPAVPSQPTLSGLRVVITRAGHQAEGLLDLLRGLGAEAVPLPLLEVVPPADAEPLQRAATDLERFDWIAFSSANAATAFLPLCALPPPRSVRIAVVGAATDAAVRALGVEPHLQATRSDAEGLVAELLPHLRAGSRILLPQAADARPALAEGLRRGGAEVAAVVAYDKRLPAAAPESAARLFGASPLGFVTFTSPRIVRHFAALFGAAWSARREELRALSIGAVTSAELRRQGVERIHQAESPSDEGLLLALIAALE